MGSGIVLPISVLMPAQPGAAFPRAIPASLTRGTLLGPGLDLPDPCGARGEAITMRPFCHPRIRRSDMYSECESNSALVTVSPCMLSRRAEELLYNRRCRL